MRCRVYSLRRRGRRPAWSEVGNGLPELYEPVLTNIGDGLLLALRGFGR
jgi:hypothetical protein